MRQFALMGALAACMTGAPAVAQQPDPESWPDTWYAACETDPNTGAEDCFTRIWTDFRGFPLIVSAKDAGAESYLRATMPPIELRYAQMALLSAGTVFELVCDGAQCVAGEDAVRAILDGLSDARELRFRLTAGTGQVAVVSMESHSYKKAVADLAAM